MVNRDYHVHFCPALSLPVRVADRFIHSTPGQYCGKYFWGCANNHEEGICGSIEWIAEDDCDEDLEATSDVEVGPTGAGAKPSSPLRSPLTIDAFGRKNRGPVAEGRRTAVDIGMGAATAIGAECAAPEVQPPLLQPQSPDYEC